ncbi:MAG: IPT/TIG domain-containing protein [Myxococcales bacterium]
MIPDGTEDRPDRNQLKETLAPSPECATLEELAALANASLPAPSRARVAVHVASCERCEVELALLKEFESASPRPEEDATVQWIVGRLRRRFREARVAAIAPVAAAHEEEEGFWRRLIRVKPVTGVGFGLAAAMVLVAAGLELRVGGPPSLPDRIEQGSPVRSNAVTLGEPAGDLDARPAALRWKPVPGAASYSVEVMEVDHAKVWNADVASATVALPDTVTARLVPGKPLLWQVVALDGAGKTIATSQAQRFRVKPQAALPAAPPAPSPDVNKTSTTPAAPVMNVPRGQGGSQLAMAMPCPSVAGGGRAFLFGPSPGTSTVLPNGLSLKVLSRTAPPDGTAQLTVALTEPEPIATGCGSFVTPGLPFDNVLGAALFTASGAPSDVAGAAVIDGTAVRVQAISPSGDFGTSLTGDPIAVVTFHVSPTAVPGDAGKMTLDPSSLFFDPAGLAYVDQIKPATFDVGGSVSIDNVIPGSGFLPAGSTVTVLGTGFVPGTTVEVDGVPVDETFVSANRIDLVTGIGAEFHGRRIRAKNPDAFRASYYSYMRATRVGESALPLLARTMPIFPTTAASTSFVPVSAGAGQFFALAVQNPNPGSATFSVDLSTADGPIASTTLTLPPRSKIAREVSELVGIAAPAGSFLSVSSDQPVQVIGLVGDDAASSVAPVLPSLTFP